MMFGTANLAQAQDTLVTYVRSQDTVGMTRVYTTVGEKIIPDKVFEFGIPLLLIFLVLNTIISIFKIKAEVTLKEKALDKGVSEATLIELFRGDRNMAKHIYLKWFLVLAAIGLALIYVHILHQFVRMSSGYLALGFISLFVSIAFLIYYRIIRKHQ